MLVIQALGIQPDGTANQLSALDDAAESAPYLGRLLRLHEQDRERLAKNEAEDILRDSLACMRALDPQTPAEDIRRILRQCKAQTHLSLAALDLTRKWDWAAVTHAFSDFADAAVQAALQLACREAAEAGWITHDDKSSPLPGLFILALGKLGGHELNYSSDIDLIALYDPDTFPSASRSASDAASRIIKAMTRHLEDRTEHGYVLRVDLRLRPDPRSTPVAVSTRAAELYYESVGQNWERMAHIKARHCAGDKAAAAQYLDLLEPFVWRRHLDFWALDDIRAVKQQIHSEGGHAGLSDQEFDVKLGRGGIREIEFFVQTQQLIYGGRDPVYRQSDTFSGLSALENGGQVEAAKGETLRTAYRVLRDLEHRIQMLNDDHTHTLKADPEFRERVARLCGLEADTSFENALQSTRQAVHTVFSELFGETERLSGVKGNLVFTGVDPDPGTMDTLSNLGFSDPLSVINEVQGWHRGQLKATRSARGRTLLTALEPAVFQHMGETGRPDAAYKGFKTFMEGLSAGVQTLSLLTSNPAILKDLIDAFSIAPQLANDLAKRPELLETLLDGGLSAPCLDDAPGHFDDLRQLADSPDSSFEEGINAVRRVFRDAHFRIRYKTLQDPKEIFESGEAYTRLADACLKAVEPLAINETTRRFGQPPGRWVICGLGRLGIRDMTATSDLDLMVIFEPNEGVSAAHFFAKATQSLITALSAQTEEGFLYEADMALRPSGRAGPVAVRLSAFSDYYENEAWTWEHMALTRLRVITGDPDLTSKVTAEKERLLSLHRDREKVRKNALDMRQRLLREKPPRHSFDFKRVKGGLMDIDFLMQASQIMFPSHEWGNRSHNEISVLAATGMFTESEVAQLLSAQTDMRALLALERAALDGSGAGEDWPPALQARAAALLAEDSFKTLLDRVDRAQTSVWTIFCEKMQPNATE